MLNIRLQSPYCILIRVKWCEQSSELMHVFCACLMALKWLSHSEMEFVFIHQPKSSNRCPETHNFNQPTAKREQDMINLCWSNAIRTGGNVEAYSLRTRRKKLIKCQAIYYEFLLIFENIFFSNVNHLVGIIQTNLNRISALNIPIIKCKIIDYIFFFFQKRTINYRQ